MKQICLFVLLAAISAFSAGCGSSGAAGTEGVLAEGAATGANTKQAPTGAFIQRTDMQLGGITLGICENEFDRLMAADLLAETESDLYEPEFFVKERTYSDGTKAVFADFHDDWGVILLALETTSGAYETARGLAVGDSTEKMRRLYGSDALKINDMFYYGTDSGDYYQITVTADNDEVVKTEMSLLTGTMPCCGVTPINPAYFMTTYDTLICQDCAIKNHTIE
ncbi:MAG: hypothetical protein FWG42_01510 [Clostridiales bacterium]|nr:hypothetical protein [Clostridiales bacterium]